MKRITPIAYLLLLPSLAALQVQSNEVSNLNNLQSDILNQYGMSVGSSDNKINYQKSAVQNLELTATSSIAAESDATFSSASPSGLNLDWAFYTLGTGIGKTGVIQGDFNQSGIPTVILGSGESFGQNHKISFMEYEGAEYKIKNEIDFKSPISHLVYLKDNSSDNHYAVVSQTNGKVHFVNLITRKLDFSVTTGSSIQNLAIIDSNNDGQMEVAVNYGSYEQTISIIDIGSKSITDSYSVGSNHGRMIAGSFSAPGKLEFAFTDGVIYRLEAGNLSLQMTLFEEPGIYLQRYDLNKDGIDELYAAKSWSSVDAYDASSNTKLWTYSSFDNDEIILADVTGDAIPELLLGDGQWGQIKALDLADAKELWTLENPNHGVTGLFAGDLDGDGELEVAWGGGYSSSGQDNYFVHDIKTKAREWSSKDLDPPFEAYDLVDLDNDGTEEVVFASTTSNSSYDAGVTFAYDLTSGKKLWDSNSTGAYASTWQGVRALAYVNADSDSQLEVVVGTSTYYNGTLHVLDGKTGQLQYTYTDQTAQVFRVLEVSDINADGKQEILALTSDYLYTIDASTGTLLSTSPRIQNYYSDKLDMFVGDLDGQQGQEVYIQVGDKVFVFNPQANTVTELASLTKVNSIAKAYYQGKPALFSLSTTGLLSVYQPETDTLNALALLCSNSNGKIAASGLVQLTFNCGDIMGVFDIDSRTFDWQDDGINQGYKLKSVTTADGNTRFVIGGSSVAIYSKASNTADVALAPVSLETHHGTPISGQFEQAEQLDYFLLTSSPSHGTFAFTDRTKGSFTYTPSGKSLGADSFTYTGVAKGRSMTEAEFTITITNQAPVAEPLTTNTHWNSPVTIQLPVEDADGDALTIEILSQPAHGSVSWKDQATGEVIYTPGAESLDTVSFSFKATDGFDESEVQNIIVEFSNTLPEAISKSYNTYYTTEVNGKFDATDADGDVLTFEVTQGPDKGELSADPQTGLFVYKPAGSDAYTTSVSFVAKDKFGTSSPQTVEIVVQGQPKAPEPASSGNSGGAIGWASLLLLLLFRRRSIQ